MKNISLLVLFLIFFAACKSDTKTNEQITKVETETLQKKETEEQKTKSEPKQHIETQELADHPKNSYSLKTTSGKIFTANQEFISDTKLKYTITGEGFAHSEALTIEGRGRMKNAFLADLNGDGFEEFYITSDDEGAPLLTAFASYKDKSFGEIYVQPLTERLLKDFQGKGKVYLKDGKLYRSFKTTSGETRTLQYELKMGETSYQLVLLGL